MDKTELEERYSRLLATHLDVCSHLAKMTEQVTRTQESNSFLLLESRRLKEELAVLKKPCAGTNSALLAAKRLARAELSVLNRALQDGPKKYYSYALHAFKVHPSYEDARSYARTCPDAVEVGELKPMGRTVRVLKDYSDIMLRNGWDYRCDYDLVCAPPEPGRGTRYCVYTGSEFLVMADYESAKLIASSKLEELRSLAQTENWDEDVEKLSFGAMTPLLKIERGTETDTLVV